MRIIYQVIFVITSATLLIGCGRSTDKADAYGNFEAIEVMVASDNSGRALTLNCKEGSVVKAGAVIATIDTLQLHFKKEQISAALLGVEAKRAAILAQLAVANDEKRVAEIEMARIESLLNEKAATPKQWDDISGKVSILEKRIYATKVQLLALEAENKGLVAQQGSLSDLIKKSRVKSPISGTILQKYIEDGELVVAGKPLVKIANLNLLELKVYVSGSQLSDFKLGNTVKILIDKPKGELADFSGVITWISDKAEFTPKIIQTKEERVDMVYAVKIQVKNGGELKIGMPAEVRLK